MHTYELNGNFYEIVSDDDCFVYDDIKEYFKPLEIDCNGEKINLGLTICEDAWSKNYSLSPMDIINRNNDVDMFINISSSPYTLVKDTKRHTMYENNYV